MTVAVLGVDWAPEMAAEFAGDLDDATIAKDVAGGFDADNPAGAPAITTTMYACKAIALAYAETFVDGELVKQGDYQVLILRSTITSGAPPVAAPGVVPNPGDRVSVPPPAQTVPRTASVVRVVAITEAFVTVQVRGVGL